MKRRAIFLLLFCIVLMLPVSAEGAGKWVFDRAETYCAEPTNENARLIGADNTLTTWERDVFVPGYGVLNGHEWQIINLSWSDPPAEFPADGIENVEMTFSVSLDDTSQSAAGANKLYLFGPPSASASAMIYIGNAYTEDGELVIDAPMYIGFTPVSVGFDSMDPSTWNTPISATETVYPSGSSSWLPERWAEYAREHPEQHLMIVIRKSLYDGLYARIYHYHYVGEGLSGEYYTDASETPGEEEGPAIPPELAILVGGPAAVIIGGKLLGGGKKKKKASEKKQKPEQEPEPEQEDRGSTFRMVFCKDFANFLQAGGKPKTVGARIEETTAKGVRRDRDDLTARIRFTGDGNISVLSEYRNGRYRCAEIQASAEAREAYVNVVFAGAEGTITNHVRFRVVGEPSLVFPDQNDGTGLFLDVLAGDGGTYRVRFFLENAVEEPVRITVEGGADFVCSAEKTETPFTYDAVLLNRSAPAASRVTEYTDDVNQGSFVSITAYFENGSSVQNSFRVLLYPEGLSVSCRKVKNGRMLVPTDENKQASEWDYVIKPTEFRASMAYREGDQTVVLHDTELSLAFGELTPGSPQTTKICSAFRYRIGAERSDDGIYTFEPEQSLSQENPDSSYPVQLLVSTGIHGGAFMTLPILLTGEVPPVDHSDWDREYELLKSAVVRYGLGADSNSRLLIRCARSFTANELCMVRRAVIIEACHYYIAEGREFMAIEARLAQCEFVFSTVKFLGDQAFAYLIKTYCGGDAVEAFVSPMKDMFAEWAGECIASRYYGTPNGYGQGNFWAALSSGCENQIMNVVTGKETPTPKKMIGLVSMFLTMNFCRRYYQVDDTKGDIYKSIVGAFGDLSIGFVKSYLGEVFGKLMDTKQVNGKTLGDLVRKYGPKDDYDLFKSEWSSVDIAEKYFTETLGLAIGAVYDKHTKTLKENVVGAYEKSGVSGVTVELGRYTIILANPSMALIYFAGLAFDVAFDCIKTLIPSRPKPLAELDSRAYYPPKGEEKGAAS